MKLSIIAIVVLFTSSGLAQSIESSADSCISAQSFDLRTATIDERLAYIRDERGFSLEAARLAPLFNNIDSMSEADRIVAAQLMYVMKSPELSKMHSLLEFEPSTNDLRVARLRVISKVDALSGLTLHSVREAKEALELKNGTSGILNLISLDRAADNEATARYSEWISSLSDSNPYKPFAEGLLEIRKNGWRNSDKISAFAKTAFDACPSDSVFAESYAYSLIALKRLDEAAEILEKARREVPHTYPASVDVGLAEIYLRSGEYEKATEFINSAEDASLYLEKDVRVRLSKARALAARLAARSKSRWITSTFMLGLLSLILAFTLLRGRKV